MDIQPKSYRDSISTIDKAGKRVWVFPKMPKGAFHNKRLIVTWGLLIFMFVTPFITVGGQPLFLFNFYERRFNVFGQPFWPQDFYLVALGMMLGVVLIVVFTVIFGRLFCGWVCPQTIFMEMVFRKIEYWIEGDWNKQKRLDRQEWNAEKIWKKTLKHFIFAIIAFLVGNTALAWIIGVDKLKVVISEPVSEHVLLFSTIIIFSAIFYWIFAFFREQVCTIACPYGRLQGVMLDKNSVVISYDNKRGEERGKLRKGEERTIGDCIDCKQCVHVCPTGIDIRNGTQLECINCTACIDECDNIMDMIGKPRGLIRFASENNIEKGEKFQFTPRIWSYIVVLFLMSAGLFSLLLLRSDIDSTLLRVPGMLFQKTDDGRISNLYDMAFINKTLDTLHIELKAPIEGSEIEIIGRQDIFLLPQNKTEAKIFVKIPEDKLDGISTKVSIEIWSKDEKMSTESTTFLGPAK